MTASSSVILLAVADMLGAEILGKRVAIEDVAMFESLHQAARCGKLPE